MDVISQNKNRFVEESVSCSGGICLPGQLLDRCEPPQQLLDRLTWYGHMVLNRRLGRPYWEQLDTSWQDWLSSFIKRKHPVYQCTRVSPANRLALYFIFSVDDIWDDEMSPEHLSQVTTTSVCCFHSTALQYFPPLYTDHITVLFLLRCLVSDD